MAAAGSERMKGNGIPNIEEPNLPIPYIKGKAAISDTSQLQSRDEEALGDDQADDDTRYGANSLHDADFPRALDDGDGHHRGKTLARRSRPARPPPTPAYWTGTSTWPTRAS